MSESLPQPMTQQSYPTPRHPLTLEMEQTLSVETLGRQASVRQRAFWGGVWLLSQSIAILKFPAPNTAARFPDGISSRTVAPRGAIRGIVAGVNDERRYKVALWSTPYAAPRRTDRRLAGSCSCAVWRELDDQFCEHLVAAGLSALGYHKDADLVYEDGEPAMYGVWAGEVALCREFDPEVDLPACRS